MSFILIGLLDFAHKKSRSTLNNKLNDFLIHLFIDFSLL